MPGASGRVLVVDDSEVIRQLIRVNLELEGFEVVTAADGAECLEVVRRVAPDVVTLDVMMPRLDGLRTAARLRAAPETRRLPIAIISACTPADLRRGEAVGVDGYLAKPFDPAELLALVDRLRQLGAAGRAGGFAYGFGVGAPTRRDSAVGEQGAVGESYP
ncbi:response regulator [Kitasatospora sp. NPDC049258]|uniref:response regulator n=1 Tax=Kitasatospora sp. NPDC049258 TaxID=3155394 RepID=UPI00341FF187